MEYAEAKAIMLQTFSDHFNEEVTKLTVATQVPATADMDELAESLEAMKIRWQQLQAHLISMRDARPIASVDEFRGWCNQLETSRWAFTRLKVIAERVITSRNPPPGRSSNLSRLSSDVQGQLA